MTVQFASLRGIHTIFVFRDRAFPNVTKADQVSLPMHGGTLALTETELPIVHLDNKRIVLTLNSVFGAS
jgi:hypothetical protein